MDDLRPIMRPAGRPIGASFKERWAEYARDRGIADDPFANVPPQTVMQARLDALSFFADGIEYNIDSMRKFAHLMRDEPQGHTRTAVVKGP